MKITKRVFTIFAAFLLVSNVNSQETSSETQLRRPAAIAVGSSHAFVANQRSGSISLIDLETHRVIGEQSAGKKISDICLTKSGQLIVTDFEAHELIVFDVHQTKLTPKQRIPVAQYPIRICFDEKNNRVYLASLWSQRLGWVDLDNGDYNQLDLPFAPKELSITPSGQLIVAAAFGGQLSVFDPNKSHLAITHELPGHNIQGLAVNQESNHLIVSHQVLAERTPLIRQDVHWGMIMSNDLRFLELDRVLATKGSPFERSHLHGVGIPDNAAADPAGIVVRDDGLMVVALSGVDEVAFGRDGDFQLTRLGVGNRPMDVQFGPNQEYAYIVNMFSDSVSVLDLASSQIKTTIELGRSKPKLTPADRGESLFFDGRLSHNGWMSCHSCHTDGHSSGLMTDNLSDNSHQTPKRILSLLGSGETAPYAWNAEVENLETQVRNSILRTMVGDRKPSDQEVSDLAAYIRSLPSPPPLSVARKQVDAELVERGRMRFKSLKCANCHEPGAFTTPKTYHVGLVDEAGHRFFNPPSLRGVSQRSGYFHDKSVGQLEDVFTEEMHQLDDPLSDEQLRELLAFLKSL